MARFSKNIFISTGGTPSTKVETSNLQGKKTVFARVVSIILNLDSEDPIITQDPSALLGIRYRILGESLPEPDSEVNPFTLNFAYPSDFNFKRVPILGEIVEIVEKPKNFNDSSTGTDKFYTFPLNIWNKTQENIYPDRSDIEYPTKILQRLGNPHSYPSLEPFEGDFILEGRGGQSLRLSNFGKDRGNYVDSSSFTHPITILRNGQPKKNSDKPVFEDINEDDSSIYLTSNHVIPLKQANTVRKSYDNPPAEADTYRGKQVIINSDRIFLNSKLDSILLSSNNSIGLNGQSVNIDSDNYIGIDSRKIYLGEQARSLPENQKQNAVKGKALEEYNIALLQLLSELAVVLQTVPPVPSAISLALTQASTKIAASLSNLRSLLASTKSNKVFVE